MKYYIPKKAKEETMLVGSIAIQDMFFIAVYTTVIYFSTKELIYPPLEILYLIFNLLASVVLRIKTKWNPEKRVYQSLYYLLSKDRSVFVPITNIESEEKKP